MPVSFTNHNRDRTFIIYWSRSVFVLSWLVNQKRFQINISFTQKREAMLQYGMGLKASPQKDIIKRKRISECIIDETMLKVGFEFIWLCITIEPENSQIPALSISEERNMFIAEMRLSGQSRFMISIRYPRTAVRDIHKLVDS